MSDYKAQQAIQAGREAYREGRTKNPYLYLGSAGYSLAAWFDKGYQEEKAKAEAYNKKAKELHGEFAQGGKCGI